MQRFRVVEYLEGYPFMVARVGRIEESEADGNEIEARFVQLKERALQVLGLLPQAPQELVAGIQGMSSPGGLADLVAGVMDIEVGEKQALLETVDLQERLDRVLDLLAHRLQVLKLSREIDERTKTSLDETQRKYFLREQMKSIQKELGEGEEGQAAEIEELRKTIAEAGMPEEVEKQAMKELKRLERMSEASGEHSMVRTYLDWLIELPWKSPAPDAIDMAEARRILDAASIR
jgi:ATP-dependent Lon protease